MDFGKNVDLGEGLPLKSSLVKNGRYELSKVEDADYDLMKSLQLGITTMLNELTSIDKDNRDLLMLDFSKMQCKDFPGKGSMDTPPHCFKQFSIKMYAPLAFLCFREMLRVKHDEFLMSMSSLQMLEENSFRIHFKTENNKFIIKNIHKREKSLLLKFLPAYYMNLTQNSKSLLPHYYGIHRYQNTEKKTFFFVIINNMFLTDLDTHVKYKLKGSITNGKKNPKPFLKQNERTYVTDSDFKEQYPRGLFVSPNIRRILLKTIRRDCLVLQSNNIVGYSLMIGIHTMEGKHSDKYQVYIKKWDRSINVFPARTCDDKEVLLSVGFDDILQLFCFQNKVKVAMNEIFHLATEGNELNPQLYAEKFRKYLTNNIIQKDNCCSPFKFINIVDSSVEDAKAVKVTISPSFAKMGNLPSSLAVPVPKFGEKLSPCNVSDWLQVHEAFNIIKLKEQPVHLERVKKLDRRVSFKDLSKVEIRNDHLDFTTQSVMSMQGSIFRGFQPLQLENNISVQSNQRNVNEKRNRTKREYFEYVDYAYSLGENNIYEDNIIMSLYSIFEAKKEMARKPTKRIFKNNILESSTENESSSSSVSTPQEMKQNNDETVVAVNIPHINISTGLQI